MEITNSQKIALAVVTGQLEGVRRNAGGNMALFAPADTGINARNTMLVSGAVAGAATAVASMTDGGASLAAAVVAVGSASLAAIAAKNLKTSVDWIVQIVQNQFLDPRDS